MFAPFSLKGLRDAFSIIFNRVESEIRLWKSLGVYRGGLEV